MAIKETLNKLSIATVTCLMLLGSAEAAFITDKLAVGLYDAADKTDKPLKVLTSGTPLEILERQSRFTKVRLSDNGEGWIESIYVTDEKPSKVMLVEAQAKAGGLEKELKSLQEKLKTLENAGSEDRIRGLNKQLADAKHTINRLNTELKKSSHRVAELEQAVKSANKQSEPPIQPEQGAGSADNGERDAEGKRLAAENRRLRRLVSEAGALLASANIPSTATEPEESPSGSLLEHWYLVVLGLAAVLGFAGGMAWLDLRHRRRHGGYRI